MNLRKKIRKILLENDELKLSFLKLMDRFGIGHALEVSGGTDKFLEITGLQKVELVKQIIYELFDEVSFMDQSTYDDKPLLKIYFNSDSEAANIDSWFDEHISEKILEYTKGNIIVLPYWTFSWDDRKNNVDVYIDTEKLKYDNLGNVINENYLIENEDSKLPSSFRRRLDLHKFEKIMEKGIVYVYYDSNSLEEFKNKLIQATLENYIFYKYEKELEEFPQSEIDAATAHLLQVFDPLLTMYYRNTKNERTPTPSKRNRISENSEDQLEKFFFKLWDQQKEKQGVVFYDEKLIKMLGLEPENITHRIRKYYVDYMGGQEELEKNVKNFFVGQRFSTNDLQKNDINVGGYDFVFKIVDVQFEQTKIPLGNGDLECYASFNIIEGNVTVFSGENFDLTDHDSISDELWWELDQEIKDMIKDFMYDIINSFGIEVDHIYLEWG